jgi:TonB family protein
MIASPAGYIFFDILVRYRWIEMRTLALILVSTFPLFAQEPLSEGVNLVGNGVSPPIILRKVEPEYTQEAIKARLMGAVGLRVIIDADGKPRDLQVVHALGMGLDENAIAAVGTWQFQPGTKGGQPIKVLAQIQVNFRLLPKTGGKDPGWHLGRADFHIPDGTLRPAVEKAVAPYVADDPIGATTTLKFDIDEKGAPVTVQIEKSSDDEWSRDVTGALAKWRFTPASKDGAPVTVPCTMDFVRGD